MDGNDSLVLACAQPPIAVNLISALAGLAQATAPGRQQLSSACLEATGSVNGAHPAQIYHDVSEEVVGWAHQIDIRSDIQREILE